MRKLIKILLKDKTIYIALLLAITIAFLSLVNLRGKLTFHFSYADKVQHLIAYFSLTIIWLLAFIKRKKTVIVLGCILYGIVMEFLQSYLTNYRTFEFMDMIANTSGVLLGLFFFNRIEKKLMNMLNSL